MKYEWKKHEKDLYGAKKTPALVIVPAQQFLTISGKGNPNDAGFSDRIAVLYSLAYAIKMEYKAAAADSGNDIHDFTVYPLEGIWEQKEGTELIKEKLEYTIMIRQPDFINFTSGILLKEALERVRVKKPSPLLDEVRFDTMQDGKCIEILHIGPFDDEPDSFGKMDQFAKANGLKRAKNCHREIYLNNARRVEKDKLKTILRYQVT